MGTLAALLLDKGERVSGSDAKENSMVVSLKAKGANVFIGHDASYINGADYIIYSSAIAQNNPELQEAKKRGIAILQRARLLAELMRDHVEITVAGAHGKTTTTSMISHLLIDAGLHPTTAVGGIVNSIGTSSRLGKGEYFVAEVDESDGTFLFFTPTYSVITNIDYEHMDFYRDFDHILDTYRKFIAQTASSGKLVVYGADKNLMDLVRASKKEFITYGFERSDFIRAENVKLNGFGSSFDVYAGEKYLGEFRLHVPGRHNVSNALACIGVGYNLAIEPHVMQQSLETFSGVQRRFQKVGELEGILVIDDYGHHPTEIAATLAAAAAVKKDRLVVVFQPHRYSRFQALINDFAKSLVVADYLIVMDIYAASEKPIPGLTAENIIPLIKEINSSKKIIYLSKEKIVHHLLEEARKGDLIMTLGAGDVTKIGYELVQQLKNKSGNFFNKAVQIL